MKAVCYIPIIGWYILIFHPKANDIKMSKLETNIYHLYQVICAFFASYATMYFILSH